MTLSASRRLTPTGYFADVRKTALSSVISVAGDVTAPTMTSAAMDSTGSLLTLTFSEDIQLGDALVSAHGFTISPQNGGAAVTISFDSSSIAANQIFVGTDRSISSTELLKISYTSGSSNIKDLAGNLLASFSNATLDNSANTNNGAPTNISLSGNSVTTTAGLNAVVGSLSSTEPDAGDTFTYALVAGTGSTNNASFNISGSSLRCNNPSVLGAGTYSVRIQTTDSAANTFAKAFTITVAVPATPVTGNRNRFNRTNTRMGVRSGKRFND